MKTEKYKYQQNKIPQKGKYIIANSDSASITVYQAFNERIAKYAVLNQKFGGNDYSFNRMSWIKPNFMWMMYRAGWATKSNQERILALKITKEGFREILANAVSSSFDAELYESREQWKRELEQSEIRLQWDPDHSPTGEKLERKAIQIGIKGKMLQQFNDSWIKQIEDITDFVKQQHKNVGNDFENLVVPFERALSYNQHQAIIKQIGLSWNCWNIYIEFIVDNEQKLIDLQHIFEELKEDKAQDGIDCEAEKWRKLFASKFWTKQAEPKYYEWLVDAYSSGEYEFVSCDWASEDTAKLVCTTWSAPYGGFDPLRELITNFNFEIVAEWH